jgi:hypothetical protein
MHCSQLTRFSTSATSTHSQLSSARFPVADNAEDKAHKGTQCYTQCMGARTTYLAAGIQFSAPCKPTCLSLDACPYLRPHRLESLDPAVTLKGGEVLVGNLATVKERICNFPSLIPQKSFAGSCNCLPPSGKCMSIAMCWGTLLGTPISRKVGHRCAWAYRKKSISAWLCIRGQVR